MSALAVVVQPGGDITVAADRAAALDGQTIAPGIAAMAPDQSKLFATSGNLALGVVGKGSVVTPPGEVVDLRSGLRSTLDSMSSPSSAATAAVKYFHEVGDVVRAHAGRGAFEAPLGGNSVLTVAVVAGFEHDLPFAFEIGLPADANGLPSMTAINWSSTYGPEALRPQIDFAVLDAAGGPAGDVETALVDAIRAAAPASTGAISLDVDVAVVRQGGSVVLRTHSYTPPPLPRT